MNKIFAPQESANDEVLNVLYVVENLSPVKRGDLLFELEASKTVIDVRSEAEGVFYTRVIAGEKVNVGSVIGVISASDNISELDILKIFNSDDDQNIKKKLNSQQFPILHKELIESKLMTSQFKSGRRIAVLGGGMGLSQVMEILNASSNYEYVGVYDDVLWCEGQPHQRYSAPVLGPIDISVITQDFLSGLFDSLVISISTSIEFRERWMEYILSENINFPNLIHPSVQVDPTAILGVGNVLLPNVHIGPHAQIGSNNFISAFSNIEHHCYVANSNTFGPGVILSGGVKIGSRCKFGTGIFVEPKLHIGDDSVIASGQVINNHIEPNSISKKRN